MPDFNFKNVTISAENREEAEQKMNALLDAAEQLSGDELEAAINFILEKPKLLAEVRRIAASGERPSLLSLATNLTKFM
ncbi:hypothetical protein SAMN05421780_1248 [Flexibacter flexilis DSM 6793]|uniref:Uncharacterized protein n=1 Tax=Flexibacter flexilis DSM 6793 TaxID=927664 RepID=A0A1I1P6G4_9BACT|nr:hypothetical protein [Flexibacter flexilis]SFD02583.1 hypothetical protein SAMN05421780_1248 [Flexibacter flexilis DSM 6793]